MKNTLDHEGKKKNLVTKAKIKFIYLIRGREKRSWKVFDRNDRKRNPLLGPKRARVSCQVCTNAWRFGGENGTDDSPRTNIKIKIEKIVKHLRFLWEIWTQWIRILYVYELPPCLGTIILYSLTHSVANWVQLIECIRCYYYWYLVFYLYVSNGNNNIVKCI